MERKFYQLSNGMRHVFISLIVHEKIVRNVQEEIFKKFKNFYKAADFKADHGGG